MSELTAYIDILKQSKPLSFSQANQSLKLILESENLTESQIAIYLTELSARPIEVDEVLGFIEAMKSKMISIDLQFDAIDTCGTGGDKSGTFNISTAVSILLAAANVKVAKHGNRSASSKCGSADVLEALGIPINLSPEQAVESIKEHGFAFLFAQTYHPALKRLSIVRKQLGFPTVFNLLGPLLNPANVKRQVIGTFSSSNAELLAKVIARLDYKHVIVLTSRDGLDEASLDSETLIYEIIDGNVKQYEISPDKYDLQAATTRELLGDDAPTNAQIIKDVFEPNQSLTAKQRVVVFNAGIGLYVAGVCDSISEGVKIATKVINSGDATRKLRELIND